MRAGTKRAPIQWRVGLTPKSQKCPDEPEALLVKRRRDRRRRHAYFANAGDAHGVGSFMPLAPVVGCIVIRPDGTRLLARVEPDPLAH